MTDKTSSEAEKLIARIEARFPNWRSFRDLEDCIDATLSGLPSASPQVEAGEALRAAYDIIVSGDPPFTARECKASVILSKALVSAALASIDEVKG